MNPSVACLDYGDPTLIRTGKFARRWGYGGQRIGNIFAYRATDKQKLLEVEEPVGPDNDRSILDMAKASDIVVLGYGQPPKALNRRGQEVVGLIAEHPALCCLKLAKDKKTPCHPLYLRADLRPIPFLVGSECLL